MSMLPLLSPTPLQAIAGAPDALFHDVESHWGFLLFDTKLAAVDAMDIAPRTALVPDGAPHVAVTTQRLAIVAFDSGKTTVLGRSPQKADVVIRAAQVSGAHAAITPAHGELWLSDLASSNGTFINGRCLAPGDAGRVALRPGAIVALGRVEVRFLDKARLVDMLSHV